MDNRWTYRKIKDDDNECCCNNDVVIRLDYCNSMYYNELGCLLKRIQRTFNSSTNSKNDNE